MKNTTFAVVNIIMKTKIPLPYVAQIKFILILGVVLAHSNIAVDYPDKTSLGIRLCNSISLLGSHICVPAFFFLSALLFFNGVEKFDLRVYASKLKRRVTTLLIPYIVWCSICCVLLFIKHEIFHMPGLGIFLDDGTINFENLIKGFWGIEQDNGRPYAFAFWFIRNLMVFTILSPIVWLICCRTYLVIMFFSLCIIYNTNLYGLEWFVAGAVFAVHRQSLTWEKAFHPIWLLVASALGFVSVLVSSYTHISVYISNLLWLTQILSALYLILYLSKQLAGNKMLNNIMPATFTIYATHQCYCSMVRRFMEEVMGDSSTIACLLAYFGSFFLLVSVGVSVYFVLKKYFPKILFVLTGNR